MCSMKLSASSPLSVKRAALTGIRSSARSHPDIPDDLIRHIYSYLPFGKRESLARTNRRFCANLLLSYTIDLKHSPVFDYNTAVLCSKPLKCQPIDILRLQGNAQHAMLLTRSVPGQYLPLHVFQGMADLLASMHREPLMQRITALDITASCVEDHHLIAIVTTGQVLERLHLESAYNVTDAAGGAIGHHCRNLGSLSLSKSKITNTSISHIAKGCLKLTHLSLEECRNIQDDALQTLAEHCPTLTSLNVKHTDMTSATPHLTKFIQTHRALKSLSLPTSSSPDVIDMLHSDFLPLLEELDTGLFWCSETPRFSTSPLLNVLLSQLPQLTSLDVFGLPTALNRDLVLFLISSGRSLRKLSIPALLLRDTLSLGDIRNLFSSLPACSISISPVRSGDESSWDFSIDYFQIDWNYVSQVEGAAWVCAYRRALRDPLRYSLEHLDSIIQPFRNLSLHHLGSQDDIQRLWDAIGSVIQSLNHPVWSVRTHLREHVQRRNVNGIPATILLDALYLANMLSPSTSAPFGS
jgi:hypothetical protein